MTSRIVPPLCCTALAVAMGCASTAPERVPTPRHARQSQAITAPAPVVVETKDPGADAYEEADTMAAAAKHLCFLAVAGIEAQAAAFDGGVGVSIRDGEGSVAVDSLRDNARILADTVTRYSPVEPPPDAVAQTRPPDTTDDAERVLVAGSDEPAPPRQEAQPVIVVTITVTDVEDGVMLLLVPDDHAMVGELMGSVQDDVAALNEGRCGS